uniref:Uncharacterized protein n=1 Tax=Grammatophora oceanica TaxID=210454 RepID=A0A7S1V1J8_9STRA|mmetsp:Transcript_3093/g.4250  ORF Transcript_3093/g.4250 Transcript_3093/m.4250 type:complete len:121 (+) Transcript_3093:182-544(+)
MLLLRHRHKATQVDLDDPKRIRKPSTIESCCLFPDPPLLRHVKSNLSEAVEERSRPQIVLGDGDNKTSSSNDGRNLHTRVSQYTPSLPSFSRHMHAALFFETFLLILRYIESRKSASVSL